MRHREQFKSLWRNSQAMGMAFAMVAGLTMLASPAGASPSLTEAVTAVAGPTSTQYPVPAGALFVATNGADGAAGTVSAPLKTVGSAVSRSTLGQTIVVRGGNYHESVVIPTNKKVIIQSYPGEVVWFDGSSIVGQWSATGGGWASNWSVKFDASPTFARGAYDGSDPGWTFLSSSYPMASHPDQVWINGVAQLQVGSLSALKAGAFFVDYGASRMYLGSDPTGKEVRASDLIQAFLIVSDGSILRGINVRRYAPSVPDFGAVSVRRPNVTLENMTVTDSATIGVSVITTKATIRNVAVSNSGMLGIHANRADGLVVENSKVERNNSEHFNMSPVAGGLKVTQTRTVKVDGGVYSGNFGNGIWFDESVYDIKVVNATVQKNLGHGVEVELSAKFIIANNIITGNGKIGVLPRNSDGGRIWNNTIVGNVGSNINLLQDSRRPYLTTTGRDSRQPYPDPTMTWLITSAEIKNNINAKPSATSNGALALRDETGRAAEAMGADIDGNFYNRVSTSSPATEFAWALAGGSSQKFASFGAYRTATGKDSHGYSVDGSDAVDTNFALTPAAASAAASAARPLPADVAALVGQPAGTARLGAFKPTVTVLHTAPSASFTSAVTGLTGSFVATATATGATIAKYSWDFGDGSATGVGAKVTHNYATNGTYSVKLTVTDSVSSVGSSVTSIAVAHKAPTVSFSSTAAGLTGSFAGSAVTTDAATITKYSWNFGDGSALASGATVSHAYSAPGTRTVTLTVTDSRGATASVSHQFVATVSLLASDQFNRTVTNGWGNATTGGTWTVSGTAANYSVSGGRGLMRLPKGSGTTANLAALSKMGTDTTMSFAIGKAPTGGAVYLTTAARKVGTNFYASKLAVSPSGKVTAYLIRSAAGAQTVIGAAVLPVVHDFSTPIRVEFLVTGKGTTNLKLKAWKDGQSVPVAWALSATDTTAALQTPGSTAFSGYLSSTSTIAPVTVSVKNVVINAAP